MRIAVVGSGPAAFGVLTAIHDCMPEAEVTVFDIGDDPSGPVTPPPPDTPAEPRYLKRLYATLRWAYGLTFPPPKTLFGKAPPKLDVSGAGRIWSSTYRGGLSNIWGAVALPFTDRELARWPIDAAALAPHYRRIAEQIGISGGYDGLNEYFVEDFHNRPEIDLPGNLKRLLETVKARSGIVAGVGRIAVETRAENSAACVYCGECMSGCARGAIYSVGDDLRRYRESGLIDRYVLGRVVAVDPVERRLTVEVDGKPDISEPFDRIFLAAGCIGTTEILMRSFGISAGPRVRDSGVLTFPMLYLGRNRTSREAAFALTNLIVGVDDAEHGGLTPIQIYPSFAHLWRYYVPQWLWPVFGPVGRVLRDRLYWCRIYLPDESAAVYAPTLSGDGPMTFDLEREVDAAAALPIIERFRASLAGSGFSVPKFKPIRHKTSSHYAATFPYGGPLLDTPPTGQVAPGLFVCDSTVFPDSQPISPTFTIIANARRTAFDSFL